MIDARLRHERGWADACILNLSRRGLMARTQDVPPRGSFVEIRRGDYGIVARVVWTSGGRFGARTQDVLSIEAMTGGAAAPVAANRDNDRRRELRAETPGERHERSRRWGRRAQMLAVTAFSCLAAFLSFDLVRDTLSRPLRLVETRLGGTS
jgi:hypothetical protein